MKKIILSIQVLLLVTVLCVFISCNKADSKCENWEYQDVCTPKTFSANCYEYVHKVSNICNGELQDAHQGRTSVIYENNTIRIERHYVRRAN